MSGKTQANSIGELDTTAARSTAIRVHAKACGYQRTGDHGIKECPIKTLNALERQLWAIYYMESLREVEQYELNKNMARMELDLQKLVSVARI